jgi:hypothetical protein
VIIYPIYIFLASIHSRIHDILPMFFVTLILKLGFCFCRPEITKDDYAGISVPNMSKVKNSQGINIGLGRMSCFGNKLCSHEINLMYGMQIRVNTIELFFMQ